MTTTDALRFTTLDEADHAAFREMVFALYAEDAGGQPMTCTKIERTIGEFARHPRKGGIFLFRIAADVAGYAIVVNFWSNEYGGDIAWIDELYVKPHWRSRGIGARFLKFLEARGDLRGLQLEVTPDNHCAERFYRRHGFLSVSHRVLFKHLLKP